MTYSERERERERERRILSQWKDRAFIWWVLNVDFIYK
jgi:hypothetical protein